MKASTLSEERWFPQAIDAISNFKARACGSSILPFATFYRFVLFMAKLFPTDIQAQTKNEIILDLYITEDYFTEIV